MNEQYESMTPPNDIVVGRRSMEEILLVVASLLLCTTFHETLFNGGTFFEIAKPLNTQRT